MKLNEKTKCDESFFDIVIVMKPSSAEINQERSEQISDGQSESWNS